MHAQAEDDDAFFFTISISLRSVTSLVYFMIMDLTKHVFLVLQPMKRSRDDARFTQRKHFAAPLASV
jgi:hypothetical protein